MYMAFLLSAKHPGSIQIFTAVVWVFLGSIEALSRFLTYWDLGSFGLHERRLWNTREVPWQEVTHVGAWNPERPSSDFLAIDYARPAPISDRGSVIANPEDRQQFIDALRRFAPQASFDV